MSYLLCLAYNRRVITLIALAALCGGLAQAPDAGARRILIEDGHPRLVSFDATSQRPWTRRDGALEGTGAANLLLSRLAIGSGDFRIDARLRMRDQKASAAAFKLGESFFGFEGARENLFLTGHLFGGFHRLGPSAERFARGAWIDFVVERRGDRIRFSIDGDLVHTASSRGKFAEFGFTPHRATMQIRELSAEGDLVEPRRPIEVMPRGYSIPSVDLSRQRERQVVVDRESGQYLGHPTTVLLEDHTTMIAVYPKGHGRGAIVMKRSVDAGRTWSERLPTPASWATSKEVPTIHRVVDGTGKRRLIMFSGLYPIRMAVSVDDGGQWSELRPIGDFGGVVAMSSVDRLRNGDHVALFHDDGRFFRAGGERQTPVVFTLYKTVSRDGGLTWSEPSEILHRTDVHLCEPGLVRSPGGERIAVLLRENSRRRNSFVIFSDDETETWSEPRELPGALTGDRHTGRYAPDGRLLITFRDTTHESPTKGDWVAWIGTWDDLVAGREGQYRVRLMDNHERADCAYPGLELLEDGTFLATTYGHWTEGQPPYIVSVRFTLDEIDAIAAAERRR